MTKKYIFSGIVQGIGFRPAAKRFAMALNITGEVKNSGGYVTIIATGEKQALNKFVQCLISHYKIKDYTEETSKEINYNSFSIVHSEKSQGLPFITPDLATCKECENELKNDKNRRYNHPFISCVNCGPRYTIIDRLPYDRENTVMADFNMCNKCNEEYTSASDRRCHAQTIACNECGPALSMTVDDAANYLKDGKVIAIKDIGGYHLACSVYCKDAVNNIRELKGRESKPFAVMFNSIDEIKSVCLVNKDEENLLLSPARPIVLLDKIKDFDSSVCCDSDTIGAFLPCNPVQILLLSKVSPLVMTSANITSEPIITDDEKVKEFGVPILSHNRRILTPIDDSVVRVINGNTQFIRRARGYVPLAVDIGISAKETTFCAGGDLKSAFAFFTSHYVFLSQHFGDLDSKGAFDEYLKCVDRFRSLHSLSETRYAVDKHTGYNSTLAFINKDNVVKIQHHKAHCASVIAEHKLKENALCFAFDGTGYGDDGAIWGSEVFTFDGNDFTRVQHLEYIDMPSSDEISKDADLCLACYERSNELINSAVKNNINTVKSSSMGRLFDAVASLLNICHYNTYEGQCACALERAAKNAQSEYSLSPTWNTEDIINQIKAALRNNKSPNDIALGFHVMIANLILTQAKKYNIKSIVLSGGVFNNRILTTLTIKALTDNGYVPYINKKVPCGDGGIALGQAYISALNNLN